MTILVMQSLAAFKLCPVNHCLKNLVAILGQFSECTDSCLHGP